MRRELNPWPALSDLFAGLLVATFGGLMLFTGAGNGGKEADPVEVRAEEVGRTIVKALQESLGGDTRQYGGDTFLDVQLHFELNKDEIAPGDSAKVVRACKALRDIFEQQRVRPEEVEIWIEGHTDSSQPQFAELERDRYLFNWRLSANRAASVLYEFRKCGLDPKAGSSYRIFSIGYADTRPIAGALNGDRQRRTTFRIRPDRCAIRARTEGRWAKGRRARFEDGDGVRGSRSLRSRRSCARERPSRRGAGSEPRRALLG